MNKFKLWLVKKLAFLLKDEIKEYAKTKTEVLTKYYSHELKFKEYVKNYPIPYGIPQDEEDYLVNKLKKLFTDEILDNIEIEYKLDTNFQSNYIMRILIADSKGTNEIVKQYIK